MRETALAGIARIADEVAEQRAVGLPHRHPAGMIGMLGDPGIARRIDGDAGHLAHALRLEGSLPRPAAGLADAAEQSAVGGELLDLQVLAQVGDEDGAG